MATAPEPRSAANPLPMAGGFRHPDPPSEAGYDSCVHCGFCLPVCPTYQVTGLEEHSPRGRVFVIKAAAEGRIPLLDEALLEPVDMCLDCRACETVCPSHVPIGTLIEQARGQLYHEQAALPPGRRIGTMERLAFRHLFPYPRRWDRVARLARWYQKSGLFRSGALRGRLPAHLRDFEAALPPVRGTTVRRTAPTVTPPQGARKARVAVFTGCVQDVVFTPVNEATVRVLARNGCEVMILRDQNCCGALNRDMGDREGARDMARRNIDRFLASGAEYIVTNAGGCGSAMVEYPTLLAGDPAYADKARAFAGRVVDVSRLLVRLGIEPPTAPPVPQRVTYHESCHLANVLATRAEPRQVLRAIPGLDLVEMTNPARCCGSAGIYNLEHPEMAGRLLEDKMDTLPDGVDVVATGNPGCALQLAVGARQRGRTLRIAHPVELLAEAYARETTEGVLSRG